MSSLCPLFFFCFKLGNSSTKRCATYSLPATNWHALTTCRRHGRERNTLPNKLQVIDARSFALIKVLSSRRAQSHQRYAFRALVDFLAARGLVDDL